MCLIRTKQRENAHEPGFADSQKFVSSFALWRRHDFAGYQPLLAPPSGSWCCGGSGSGKTTLGLALLRLLPPAMEQTSGSILYRAEDLAACSEVRLRALRGGALSMVYQEPASAFDPLYTVGRQIAEALEAHGDSAGQKRIVELLVMAGVKDPQRVRTVIRTSFPEGCYNGP